MNEKQINHYASVLVEDGFQNKAKRELAMKEAKKGKDIILKYPFDTTLRYS